MSKEYEIYYEGIDIVYAESKDEAIQKWINDDCVNKSTSIEDCECVDEESEE